LVIITRYRGNHSWDNDISDTSFDSSYQIESTLKRGWTSRSRSLKMLSLCRRKKERSNLSLQSNLSLEDSSSEGDFQKFTHEVEEYITQIGVDHSDTSNRILKTRLSRSPKMLSLCCRKMERSNLSLENSSPEGDFQRFTHEMEEYITQIGVDRSDTSNRILKNRRGIFLKCCRGEKRSNLSLQSNLSTQDSSSEYNLQEFTHDLEEYMQNMFTDPNINSTSTTNRKSKSCCCLFRKAGKIENEIACQNSLTSLVDKGYSEKPNMDNSIIQKGKNRRCIFRKADSRGSGIDCHKSLNSLDDNGNQERMITRSSENELENRSSPIWRWSRSMQSYKGLPTDIHVLEGNGIDCRKSLNSLDDNGNQERITPLSLTRSSEKSLKNCTSPIRCFQSKPIYKGLPIELPTDVHVIGK